MVLFVLVGVALAISGCTTMREHVVQRKCAWCKSQIVNLRYSIYDVRAYDHYLVKRGDKELGTVQTYDEAVKLCEQDALQSSGGSFGIIKDGVTYCSLRCLNAYEASTGIKEKRVRIIEGE